MGLTAGIIKACIEECDKSTYYYHLGCILFRSKRIIGRGYNQIRSVEQIKDKYRKWTNALHAEQAALMNIDWNKVKGCSALVLKVSKTEKKLSNAKPCPMCQAIFKHVGIKDIYYSNSDGEIVKLIDW